MVRKKKLDKKFFKLKTKKVLKGLVMLEITFDNRDRFTSEVKDAKPEELEEVNLRTAKAPKNVYIGKNLSPKIRKRLIDLLRKYRHVFSWSYDDLKTYRQDLFQHFIPFKENAKPFKQK